MPVHTEYEPPPVARPLRVPQLVSCPPRVRRRHQHKVIPLHITDTCCDLLFCQWQSCRHSVRAKAVLRVQSLLRSRLSMIGNATGWRCPLRARGHIRCTPGRQLARRQVTKRKPSAHDEIYRQEVGMLFLFLFLHMHWVFGSMSRSMHSEVRPVLCRQVDGTTYGETVAGGIAFSTGAPF